MELKMSANEASDNVQQVQGGICGMESVSRISKIPVVESTIQTATSIYEKVKDYNAVTNWSMSTAENTVHKAIEVGKPLAAPVMSHLEGSIKKVDGVLCSGLDYVETKVPAVKLPPGELYNNTKEYVTSTVTPVVQSACAVVQPAMQTARGMVEPAVQAAKHALEPAVQSARQIAEPYVQPAVDTAYALKDYGTQKVEEFLHRNHDPETKPVVECAECLEHVEKKQNSSANQSPSSSPH